MYKEKFNFQKKKPKILLRGCKIMNENIMQILKAWKETFKR